MEGLGLDVGGVVWFVSQKNKTGRGSTSGSSFDYIVSTDPVMGFGRVRVASDVLFVRS